MCLSPQNFWGRQKWPHEKGRESLQHEGDRWHWEAPEHPREGATVLRQPGGYCPASAQFRLPLCLITWWPSWLHLPAPRNSVRVRCSASARAAAAGTTATAPGLRHSATGSASSHTPRAGGPRQAGRTRWLAEPGRGGRSAPGPRPETSRGRLGQLQAARASRAGSPARGLAGWLAGAVAILNPGNGVPPYSWLTGHEDGCPPQKWPPRKATGLSVTWPCLPRPAQVALTGLGTGTESWQSSGMRFNSLKTHLQKSSSRLGNLSPGRIDRVATAARFNSNSQPFKSQMLSLVVPKRFWNSETLKTGSLIQKCPRSHYKPVKSEPRKVRPIHWYF